MRDWWKRSRGFAREADLRGQAEALRRAQMVQQLRAQYAQQQAQYDAMRNYEPRYSRSLAAMAADRQWQRNVQYYLAGNQWTNYTEWEDPDLFIDVGL